MRVYYWQNDSGRMPVYDFIVDQPPNAKQRIMKSVEYFAAHGMHLLVSPGRMKPLRGYKDLYELKIDHRGVFYRIIFCIAGDAAHLLVAFKKKDNGTAQRHIKTALNRQRLVLIA